MNLIKKRFFVSLSQRKIVYLFLTPLLSFNIYAIQFFGHTISFDPKNPQGEKIEEAEEYDFERKGDFNSDENIKQDNQNNLQNLKDNVQNSSIRSRDSDVFDWKNYENPDKLLFWDAGGDFVPSYPMRVVASHPTPENIEKFKKWQLQKIQLASKLNGLFVGENNSNSKKNVTEISNQSRHQSSNKIEITKETQQNKNDDKSSDFKNIQVAYFYQTHCPVCLQSKPIVSLLKSHGMKIIPIQVDWDSYKSDKDYVKSIPYSQEMENHFHISGTPTFILKNIKNGHEFRINGFSSLEDIENQAKNL